jgi:hypothetical protein
MSESATQIVRGLIRYWQSLLFLSALMIVGNANSDNLIDTDADGMPDYWELQYGLNPQNPSDSNSDQDSDGLTALIEYSNNTIPGGTIDIDGNGKKDALTDGLLILRYFFDLSDTSLINNVISSDAVYTSSDQIEERILGLGDLLDVDLNGELDALTDGLMTLRFLFGIANESLIQDALAPNADRNQLEEIRQHLAQLMPEDSDLDGVYDTFDIFPNDSD